VYQPNFAFRKRTTIGLSRVQKAKKTQRLESFYPPDYDDGGGLYTDAQHPKPGADNEAADVDDNAIYVNAKNP